MISLSILDETLAVCRLSNHSPIPAWALNGSFFCVTRTPAELSLVCSQENVPATIQAERNWRLIKVIGPLDFSLTGILAGLAGTLAEAGISIFAVSTYDTDYILVKTEKLSEAVRALQAAGYEFPSE